MTESERKKIVTAIADYMVTVGCGCCSDREGMDDAKKTLGKLLEVPRYKDGSGYNFYKFRTPQL